MLTLLDLRGPRHGARVRLPFSGGVRCTALFNGFMAGWELWRGKARHYQTPWYFVPEDREERLDADLSPPK